MPRPLASPGNVCDSGDTESFYAIWRSGVNPGSVSGGLAIQFQCNQILLRTHRSTRHQGLTSLLGCSQGGNGWRYRRQFRKFLVYILFVGMRSLGKHDSPEKASWFSRFLAFPMPVYIPLPSLKRQFLQYSSSPQLSHILVARNLHWLKCMSFFSCRGSQPSDPGLYLLGFSYLCQSRGLITFFAHLTSAQFKARAGSLRVFSYLSRLSCTNKGLGSYIYRALS